MEDLEPSAGTIPEQGAKSGRNPDLIFDDVMRERARRVAALYLSPAFPRADLSLDRATVFASHRRNLKCRYCNGPHRGLGIPVAVRREMLAADVGPGQFRTWLADWSRRGLRHVHFTGGEATLNANLCAFVDLCRRRSIPCTLTTNGTADPAVYESLARHGTTEFRVSIDSTDESLADEWAGVAGSSARALESVRHLAALRDRGHPLFLVLNACVGAFNLDNIGQAVESLLALRPDDMKLLVVAEEGNDVCARGSRTYVDSLLRYLSGRGSHVLLEEKVRRLFRRDGAGLRDRTSTHEIARCFVPLTERTVDGRGFYPCSIYLRYRGAPLAGADAPYHDQEMAVRHFVESHDCRDDAICVANCTGCCKQYNLSVNRLVRRQIAAKAIRRGGRVHVGRVDGRTVARVVASSRRIAAGRVPPASPFLIVKPHGLPHLAEIREYLREQAVDVTRALTVGNWRELSLMLYFGDSRGERARFRIARNRAYARMDKLNRAAVLVVEDGVPERKLFRIKDELRSWYGDRTGCFVYRGSEHLLRSNAVHVPDHGDQAHEWKVLVSMVAGIAGRPG